MKILDTQTGDIQEYGADGHDSLRVSQDGRTLSYYNLQNGDGSAYGDYRFVCDDNKVPAESETADARHANVFFNIGGWHKRAKGEWIEVKPPQGDLDDGIDYREECSICHEPNRHYGFDEYHNISSATYYKTNFCPNCGAEMKGGKK